MSQSTDIRYSVDQVYEIVLFYLCDEFHVRDYTPDKLWSTFYSNREGGADVDKVLDALEEHFNLPFKIQVRGITTDRVVKDIIKHISMELIFSREEEFEQLFQVFPFCLATELVELVEEQRLSSGCSVYAEKLKDLIHKHFGTWKEEGK